MSNVAIGFRALFAVICWGLVLLVMGLGAMLGGLNAQGWAVFTGIAVVPVAAVWWIVTRFFPVEGAR